MSFSSGLYPAAGPSAEPTVVKVGVVGANNQQWDTVNELLAKPGSKAGEQTKSVGRLFGDIAA